MPIVTLKQLHKSFGPDIVFDDLDQRLYAKEKVGMVGANGSGKSTLLNLIVGNIEPDMGQVVKRKGLRIGYLRQEASFDGKLTILEEMHSGLDEVLAMQRKLAHLAETFGKLSGDKLKAAMAEYDKLSNRFELSGGYVYETRIHRILAGLGFKQEQYGLTTSALSGGQLSRLSLAKILLTEADILLLDEPTNHLDLQATVWLEQFLKEYKSAVVIISHDRYLLDQIAEKIIEVEASKATVWKGNYSNYIAEKEIRQLQQQREHQKRFEMVERTRDFIARNKDKEGMRKTARGRKKRLDKLLANNDDFLTKPAGQKEIDFAFAKAKSKSDLIIRCQRVSKSFDDLLLFEDLSFDLLSGERLGITGPNGTGKSTLLKIALGEIAPTSGTVKMGRSLSIGYLDQHGKTLDANNTVLQEVRLIRPERSEESLRGLLGAFLFTGDDVFKPIPGLSGGEQSRLMLCKLVLDEPDVLVLDEPTNHLDISSKKALERALLSYAGAVVVVSHDRFFLDRVIDKLLVIGTNKFGEKQMGCFEFVSGDGKVYSKYAEGVYKNIVEKTSKEAQRHKGIKAQRAKKREGVPEELRRFNKFSLEQVEEKIMVLEEEITELRERFGNEEVYKNPSVLVELNTVFDDKQSELALLYRAYELRQ